MSGLWRKLQPVALQQKIDAIVERRNARVPWVTERIELLNQLQSELDKTVALSHTLSPSWLEEPELESALSRLRSGDISAALAEARLSLEALKARFSRETINIGVAGSARVGKSRLLQTVSGLSDEQVPTGPDKNVTAVRSQIFYAPKQAATISFYSVPDFFDARVRPYFEKLGTLGAPSTLDEFLRFDLDSPEFRAGLDQNLPTTLDSLRDLEILRDAVPSLLAKLGAPDLTLSDLSDLRRFVAYPASESGPRDYLAVKDVRIESEFPVTAVRRLGLVDLPGLGEADPGLEDRVIQGLRGDVDAVLLIKRSTEQTSNITGIDMRALDIITRARGDVQDSRDFAWAVINTKPGSGEEGMVASLKEQIQDRLNTKVPDSRILTVVANAADTESVHENVLIPVLERLAGRLDSVDKQLTDAATLRLRASLDPVFAALQLLTKAIRDARSVEPSDEVKLNALAERLRESIQKQLSDIDATEIISRFLNSYSRELQRISAEVEKFLDDGLGMIDPLEGGLDKEGWKQRAVSRFGVAQSQDIFTNAELHRMRVEITKRFAAVDQFLNEELLEHFYDQVCSALAGDNHETLDALGYGALAELMPPKTESAEARIRSLVERLEQSEHAIPGITAAFKSLLGIKFDFRMQSYPTIAKVNERFHPHPAEYDLATGKVIKESFPPDFGARDVEAMYMWFWELFTRYSYDITKALERDAVDQFRVFEAALELFEDELIRSGTSDQEFKAIARGYRDELWPGVFANRNSKSASGRALGAAAQSALDSITELERQD